MPQRLRPSLSFQIVLAVVFGATAGAVIGEAKTFSPWAGLLEQTSALVGFIALGWLRALAIPLIVSSVVLGGVGLEPMRRMGTIAGKTLRWIVFTNLLAVALAVGVVWLAASIFTPTARLLTPGSLHRWQSPVDWRMEGWLGLVLVSLACGYYRNEIEEGRARMLTRFCQGVEEMLTPILHWTQGWSAVGIFFLMIPTVSMGVSLFRMVNEDGLAHFEPLYVQSLLVLLATVAIYVSALSVVVWWQARVNLWRLVPALLPAMLMAASGRSLEAAFPLTMDALRRRGGISNRVASVTLSLCTGLNRDGLALGWTSVALCLEASSWGTTHWSTLAETALAAVVVGCGLGALSGESTVVPLMFLGVTSVFYGSSFPLVLGGIIASLGGAVSVFSQAGAAVLIARGEGEFWVPGTPPQADELAGLKSDLEAAEG